MDKDIDVQFLQDALDDLDTIVSNISKDSRKAALDMHNKIINRANDLKIFPKRGIPVPDKRMAAAGYRMLGILPYIAFYRFVDNIVFIYRVLHGASNYPSLYNSLLNSLNESSDE